MPAEPEAWDVPPVEVSPFSTVPGCARRGSATRLDTPRHGMAASRPAIGGGGGGGGASGTDRVDPENQVPSHKIQGLTTVTVCEKLTLTHVQIGQPCGWPLACPWDGRFVGGSNMGPEFQRVAERACASKVRRCVSCVVVLLSLVAPISGAMAQGLSQGSRGPVSASDVGGGGRFTPQPARAESEPARERDRSERAESRRQRSLIRLGIWGVVGIATLAGGIAARSAKSPKHRDGTRDGRVRGRGITQSSSVPPGSTRFR